jgi:riboflavin kinase/FMN adenylyltransferase
MKPLFITGVVESGLGLATSLGCPTANLAPEEGLVIPGMGVYLGFTKIDAGEEAFPSVLCVGAGRDQSHFKIEVHLLDTEKELRGKRLTVEVVGKLRSLIPWPGEETMKGMIAEDLVNARHWFSQHP